MGAFYGCCSWARSINEDVHVLVGILLILCFGWVVAVVVLFIFLSLILTWGLKRKRHGKKFFPSLKPLAAVAYFFSFCGCSCFRKAPPVAPVMSLGGKNSVPGWLIDDEDDNNLPSFQDALLDNNSAGKNKVGAVQGVLIENAPAV